MVDSALCQTPGKDAGMEPIDLSILPATAQVGPGGGLTIGGVDLTELAAEFGTPLFVYDEQDLVQRFRAARETFGPGTAYATKAFTCRALVRLAHAEGLSLDVSTAGEYYVCRQAGIPASSLVVHGNLKTREELTTAVAEGVQWIVVDNFDELNLLSSIVEELEKSVPVLIRVNPGVEVHTHKFTKTGNRGSKFGFPLWTGDAELALRQVAKTPRLDFKGVHIHVGSLVLTIDAFLSAIDSVAEFVRVADGEVFVVGGGLGVRYLNGDTAPDLRDWGRAVVGHCREIGITGTVLAEPGRYLVAPTAVTLYTIGSLTMKGDHKFAMVDGGMIDNPRPQLYGSDYEVFLPRAVTAERDLPVTVVGRHCESSDTLVRAGHLPADTTRGDIACTPVTGAYGYSMASNYNVLPRPPVVFVRDGRARMVIRRETHEDLIKCDLG